MVPLRAKHFTALSWGWGANTLIFRSLCNDYHLLLRLRLQRQMARCTEAIHQTPKRNFVFLPHLASSSLHHFLPLLILHLFYFNLSCYSSPRGQGLSNVKNAVPQKYIGWQWTHYPSYIPSAGAREGRWKSTLPPPPSWTAALQKGSSSTGRASVLSLAGCPAPARYRT